MNKAVTGWGSTEQSLSDSDVCQIVAEAVAKEEWAGKRLLLIIPDATRTAPVGLFFKMLYPLLKAAGATLDIMIALGTHPPMSQEEIFTRLEITAADYAQHYADVRLLNHAWDDPSELAHLGTIPAADIEAITDGLFSMDVPVEINRHIFEYDRLVIVGPVFPHEVVGFSGGNKYLFPGISGPDVLNFFHWLGAVITNAETIGRKGTPVRAVLDRAAALVPVEKRAFCLVVYNGGLSGLFVGEPEAAWSAAADLSDQLHIIYKPRPFHTVLSCAPLMYDELWVGGKCMYKLEPVVADGGELIIYAPHLKEISRTHGALIERLGYHVRDYFRLQWDQFQHEPWGVIAHSSHVRGGGTFIDGIERPRVCVTLATGIPEEVCTRINLGYRDWRTIRVEDYQDREDEGILYVPHAGEMLFRLAATPRSAP